MLTVTEMLRKKGVVDKFVEFFGDGLANLPLADRATIANMAPEYGSTCGIFPIDEETLRYLELSGRTRERLELVERLRPGTGPVAQRRARRRRATPMCSSSTSRTVEPSLAGPRRPQDRVPLKSARAGLPDAARSKAAEERTRANPRRQGVAPRRCSTGTDRRAARTARC